ncbi:MAG: hypothetical protein M3Y82_05155 [Verrucomicrobiota bacterium]|nr:hypothetical protein [Verrucomicrobiota bacterium]
MTNITTNENGGTPAQTTRPLSAKAAELLNDQSNGLPVWIRSPKHGVEFYCGMSRAKLYEGAGKGHFRSVSIREPGQVKGTRLFHLQSILDFIEKCELSATKEGAGNV